jgi:predicted RNA-binding protein YlxR (DUF448 family)
MKKRHVPKRMCVSCRQVMPKHMLLRFVKSDSGEILMDKAQLLEGRGAYVCSTPSCIAMALKRGGLQKALKACLKTAISGVRDGEASLRGC